MKQDMFSIKVQPDGTEFLMQTKDELDKNHSPDDTQKNKQGRMYSNGGKLISIPTTT